MKFSSFTLPNNLQVLTISDDRFIKSSAAMAVMSGSMQNPSEHLGLAHFLEHMLFLGTKEFPEVGEYEDFLNKNGGGNNAYTSIDHTNYFFDVNHEAFDGALQRFSRFFVSPTFDPKYVEREKNAVNSEHEKNRKDDYRREYRVQQIMSDASHPYAQFATGDKNTLAKADRTAVMDFYQKTYSANIMRLVLMSQSTPSELEKLVRKYFADVPDRNLPKPEYREDLFPKQGLPRSYHVKSVRDQQILKISFDIPDELRFWKSKPGHLLAHLVGDEGEGSLLSHLKKDGLALGLSTSTYWRTFNIRVTLTELGKKHPDRILRAVFAYVALLKKEGLHKHIFTERQQLAEIELKNIEPKSSMSRASDFSSSMLYYSAESFLSDHYLFHEYSPKDFNHFLSFLRVDNMQTVMFSRDAKTNEVETYYGIEYGHTPIDGQLVKELASIQRENGLALPEPNPFIPTDFSLVTAAKTYSPKKETYRDRVAIFSQVDTELEVPKGSIAFSFSADIIKQDPRTYLVAHLYSIAKGQELNEWGYPARLSGLNYNISHGNNTITVEVSGYNQNLHKLFKQLIFDPENKRRIDHVELPADLFDRVKKKYKRNLLNADYDAAYQRLLYENSQFFVTGTVHRDRYKQMVDQITLEEINQFAKKFFAKVAVRAYAFGNLEVADIKGCADHFLKHITQDLISEQDIEKFESKYVQLPGKHHAIKVSGKNNNNSQLTLYKTSEWTIRDHARVDVLSKLIEQPFFTELRTHQQLGYVVAAFGAANNGFCGLGTLIQSQTTLPVAIHQKANKFVIEHLEKLSATLSDQDIAPIKAALINEISRKPNTMNERLSRFTAMAGTYHGDFAVFEKLVREIKAVTADELKKYIKEKILDEENRQTMSLFYYGVDAKSESLPAGIQLIDDILGFKSKLPKSQPYRNSFNM